MRFVSLASLIVAIAVGVLPLVVRAQTTTPNNSPKDECPGPLADKRACSYTATNGNCKIMINRLKPVTPPTIYVRRYCQVKVIVSDLSPLEDLTLDWKSSSAIVPPDTFQTAFTANTTNLGKLSIVGSIKIGASAARGSGPDIVERQKQELEVLKVFDPLKVAGPALKKIKDALQPPPGEIASDTQPWRNTEAWINDVKKGLQVPIDQFNDNSKKIEILSGEVREFEQTHKTPSDKAIAKNLDTNQKTLNDALGTFDGNIAKLSALTAAVETIKPVKSDDTFSATIKDTRMDVKNYQIQAWTLDYTNKLLPEVKRVAAETLKTVSAAYLGSLAETPAKLPIVTITVQFQSPSRVEVSTGLMVPLTPFHSYTKASVAANGVVSNNVVQETTTYAVVPMAFVNVRAKEWIARQQRSAFYFTGGVGINPTTTAVEFGAGCTYSYRSIAVSGLVDIGRDTKLGGGFKVGESLGPTNAAANPITSTYWAIKPALALSVRIPLGGSGSSK